MARINNTRLLSQLTRALRLESALEKTPDQLAKEIVPTFDVHPKPRTITIQDTVANDSNKTITVPDGKQWKLLYGIATLITTATVGDRQFTMFLQDSSGNILYRIQAANVQTASTTERYNLVAGPADVSETVTGTHLIPIPFDSILPEGFRIVIQDSAAIAAAADDLNIFLMIEESDMNPEL